METEKIKELIRKKLDVIDEGDINLDGESSEFIEGFRNGLAWVLDEVGN